MPKLANGGTPATSSSTPSSRPTGSTDTIAANGASARTGADIRKLLLKADQGNKQAFETACADYGHADWLWERAGNMAVQAQEALLTSFLSKDALFSTEAQRRKCAALTRELEGEHPTPLEKLLVERIVLCWLHLHGVEALYAQHTGSLSIVQATYQLHRITTAHNRYLSAIRTLAHVRRLPMPNVQVNIAREQLNVAAIAPAHVDQARAQRTAR